MPDIFSSMTIKNNEIKNRIVLPPMVRFGWSEAKGFVSKKHIEHYSLIAEKGPGLIIKKHGIGNFSGIYTHFCQM